LKSLRFWGNLNVALAGGIVYSLRIDGQQKGKKMPKFMQSFGWFGAVLLQTAPLPNTFQVWAGNVDAAPPLTMILMLWCGLALYLVYAIYQKDKVYIASNVCGLTLNSVTLVTLLSI
jgi:uncharacterized protein with PQ loop repeat